MATATVLMAISLGASAVGFAGQMGAAQDAQEARAAQIREQQVSLRLQENERSLQRGELLRQTLATAAVQSSIRGISPGSSTLRAITEESLQNFMEDENMDKLNFGSKRVQLGWSLANSRTEEKAQMFSGATQFGTNVANLGYQYSRLPGSNLVDASKISAKSASNFNPNSR